MEQEIHRVVLSITLDYNAAKAKEQALADAMEAQRRAAMDLRANAAEASILEGEVEANRSLYDNILKRTKETGLARVGPTSNIRVVDRADLPIRPDDTKATRTLLLSVLVGLLGGVGVAFLRHYLDNTLKTPADIGRFIRLPTLGMVPDIRRLDKRMVSLGYLQKGSLTRKLDKGPHGRNSRARDLPSPALVSQGVLPDHLHRSPLFPPGKATANDSRSPALSRKKGRQPRPSILPPPWPRAVRRSSSSMRISATGIVIDC